MSYVPTAASSNYGAADPAIPDLLQHLGHQVTAARKIIYQLDKPTPLCKLDSADDSSIWLKREDLSTIRSYKWRGAFYSMHQHVQGGNTGPFVAASAGNHAQGVAASAAHLGVPATIFMPCTTPLLKQQAVHKIGGEHVTIRLVGDNFDHSAQHARDFRARHDATMIQPFDELAVVAGQATVGCELMDAAPDLEAVYIPIGGGGLASGIAVAYKVLQRKQKCKIIGVEVERQDSMYRSWKQATRTALEDVDLFCDGTAVGCPGQLTFALCREFLDDIRTVSNSDVCRAMEVTWNQQRFIPEPSGAIALAAALQDESHSQVAAIVSGGNMDLRKLPRIVREIDLARQDRRYFRFTIPEKKGALIGLLDNFFGQMNIVDFQYGKSDLQIAHPVIGIEAPSDQLSRFAAQTELLEFEIMETSQQPQSRFRVIPFQPELCRGTLFLRIDFPHRPGALLELMRRISNLTNICYFDFCESGESEGRALIGFEIHQADSKSQLLRCIRELKFRYQISD